METEGPEAAELSVAPEPQPGEPLTSREKLLAVGAAVVVVGLTVLATAFAVMFASDAYVGVVAAADRGIHGTYLVTELVTGPKATSSVGTYTSDDGSVVLVGTTLPWDASDVGSEVRCQYVPSLRDGHLPVGVSRGSPADVILPMILLVICLALAVAGWWLMGAVVLELARDAIGSRVRER